MSDPNRQRLDQCPAYVLLPLIFYVHLSELRISNRCVSKLELCIPSFTVKDLRKRTMRKTWDVHCQRLSFSPAVEQDFCSF